jgi:hypothetical protein
MGTKFLPKMGKTRWKKNIGGRVFSLRLKTNDDGYAEEVFAMYRRRGYIKDVTVLKSKKQEGKETFYEIWVSEK